MNDQNTTLHDLRQIIAEFVDQRDWEQFHAPKNISMAMAIEVAELMEHFQWLTVSASRKVVADAEKLNAVAEEMADVLCYLLALANELDVDMTAAMIAKMEKNRRKYPPEEYRGRFGPEDPSTPD
jgi:NTP pyrophosphatase (non-canonical NTP hydrolase)